MVPLQALLERHARQTRQFMTIHCSAVTSIKDSSCPLDDACCSPPLSRNKMNFSSLFRKYFANWKVLESQRLFNKLVTTSDMTSQSLGNRLYFHIAQSKESAASWRRKALSIPSMGLLSENCRKGQIIHARCRIIQFIIYLFINEVYLRTEHSSLNDDAKFGF